MEGGGMGGMINSPTIALLAPTLVGRRWSCNKNGFWERPFLGSVRTPEYGIHLRMAIWGPAKVG